MNDTLILGIVILTLIPLILMKPVLGIYLICLSIPLSPSIPVGKTPIRDITVRAEDILLIATLVSWAIKRFPIPRTGEGVSILKILLSLALLYILSTMLNILNLSFAASLFFLLKYIQYWLFFLMAFSLVSSYDEAKTVCKFYFLSLSLALIYWIYHYVVGGDTGALRFPFHVAHGGRENVGIYLLGAMSFSLSFFTFEKIVLRRLLFLFIFSLSSVIFIKSLSRASYLGGTVWMLFNIFFTRRRETILLFLTIITVFPFLAPSYFFERIEHTFHGEGGGTILGLIYVESSVTARILTWKSLLSKIISESPFLGFGVTGTGLVDSQYLRVLGESGIVGFFLFVYLLFKLFTFFFNSYRKQTSDDTFLFSFSLGMCGWFVGILFHMIPANTFVLLQTSEAFWLLTGTLCAVQRLKNTNERISVK